MKGINKIISLVDILGEKVKLRSDKEERSTTVLGATFTILIMVLIGVAGFTIGKELYMKKLPFLILENQLLSTRPYIILNNKTLPLAIDVKKNDLISEFNLNFLKIELLEVRRSNFTESYNYYSLSYCKNENFPNFSKEYLGNLGIENFLCVDDQNLTIGGGWDEEFSQHLSLRIGFCKNSTEKNDCAPIEEIQNYLISQKITLQFYYQNSFINSYDNYNPLNYYLLQVKKILTIGSIKKEDISIQVNEINTDNGLIFENKQALNYLSHHQSVNDNYQSNNSKFLCEINLLISNNKQISHRSYIKLQYLLAYIGGLTNMLLVIGYYMTFYFSRIELEISILNKVFDFNTEDNSFNILLRSKSHVKTLNSHISDNIINKLNINVNQLKKSNLGNLQAKPYMGLQLQVINENLSRLKSHYLINNTDKKLNFNFFQTIKYSLFPKCYKKVNKSWDIFQNSRHVLNDILDIGNILKKLDDLEKLKICLLNEEELAMFELANHTLFDINDLENRNVSLRYLFKEFSRNKENQLKLARKFSNKYKNNENGITELQNKLLHMLDDDIKN